MSSLTIQWVVLWWDVYADGHTRWNSQSRYGSRDSWSQKYRVKYVHVFHVAQQPMTPNSLLPRQCVPKQKARALKLTSSTSTSPTFQQPQAAATTPPQQQHPHLPRPIIAPQTPTSPVPTALVRSSHLPQHHNISFCPQNFNIHPHSGVPLRRLTHINSTCIRLHHPPIATVTTLHSLRVSTTSSQQPIRLAGDTRPPPA